MSAEEIISALIAISGAKLWAREVSFSKHGRRADFWTIEPTASQKFRATAYEVKVTRADYLQDTHDKQKPALLYSDRFFYVTPPGLVQRQELPSWAGLLEWDGKTFSVKKKAPKREKIEPDWQLFIDVMRTSGRCRRDSDLMVQEIGFLRHRLRELSERAERRDEMDTAKMLRRWSANNK
jgi:hypothetical protein